jgi:hypothetical protein
MKCWSVGALAVLGLVFGMRAGAQALVMDATVCDVVKKPAPFDGKMVRIKGTVIAGFDEFAIKDAADPNCGFQVDAIWLEYPAGTKGKAGPAAIVELQPARNFAGQYAAPTRAAVTLEKSKDFKQFDSLLAQTHQKNADMCLGCTRYEVTATLVGRLDTVASATLKRDASGKIAGFGGFGNMNAYPARLVLQSVTDVTPKEIDYSKSDAAAKGDANGPGNLYSAMTATQNAAVTSASSGGGGDLGGTAAMIQRAAAKMAASPLKDLAVKAADAFGKPGEKNGVNIGFGRTNETPNEGLGSQDSPDGVLFNCTFNQDRLQGDALANAVAHIGTHITELRDPEKGNENAPPYVLESDAWVVTTFMALTSGQKYLTLPGGYQVWNMNWTADQRNDKMQSVLKDFLLNEMELSR